MASRQHKYVRRKFNMVRLYLDDLEKIESVLKGIKTDDPAWAKLTVAHEELKGGSVRELVEEGGPGPFHEFDFERTSPGSISVRLGRMDTTLTVSDVNTNELHGASEKIAAILKAARLGPVQRALVSNWMVLLYTAPFWLAFNDILYTKRGHVRADQMISLGVGLAFGVATVGLAWWMSMSRNGLAFLTTRPTNFFVRQRDPIWIAVITVVLTAVVTVAVDRLSK